MDLTSYLYKAEPQVPSNSQSEAEALTAKTHPHFLGLHPMPHAGPQTEWEYALEPNFQGPVMEG